MVQVTSTPGVPMSLESLVDSSTFLSADFILFSSKCRVVQVTLPYVTGVIGVIGVTLMLPPKASSYCSQVSERRCRSFLPLGCLHWSH